MDRIQLTKDMALSPYSTIKKIWSLFEKGNLEYDISYKFCGQCVTSRGAKSGKLLFIELCDGSTVKTLQCVCDSDPEEKDDLRRDLDWKPLFQHCHRGATVELTGKLIKSPAAGQPIEFVVTGYQCLGKISDPESYPLGSQSYMSRDYLRQVPDKRHHTLLFLAIGIIKQVSYKALHEIMAKLKIGEVQPTLITGNECEDGAHPFTVTTILDKMVDDIPMTDDGRIDWNKDFFDKRVFLTVSSQLHLEATVLGLKRDGYCMTTAFRAEPSDTTSHLAEFLMPEWELIGGGIERNMAVAQMILQHVFETILEECYDELEYLETYHRQEEIEEDEGYKAEMASLARQKETGQIGKKKFTKDRFTIQRKYRSALSTPSLIDKLKRYASEPYIVTTHKECVRQIRAAVEAGDLSKDMLLDYGDDLSRQHEYWICREIGGGLPVAVTGFPKKIKAFYMPIIHEDDPVYDEQGELVEHIDGYDFLIPDVGEVIGGSQRIDDADELVGRMKELGMSLDELDWYIGLRRDASLPHGGAGLGFGRLMVAITGIHNIKDMQEFPRAFKLRCVA